MAPDTIVNIRHSLKLTGKHRLHRTTQAEFAALLGIPASTLRAWECGAKQPAAAAVTLLKALQARPAEIQPVLEALAESKAV